MTNRFLLGVAITVLIFLIVGATLFLRQSGLPDTPPVVGTSLNNESLAKLRAKAEAGDAKAQYEFSLFVDDLAGSSALIARSAKAGYPPAVVLFAAELIDDASSGAAVQQAREMLLTAANGGYYPAVVLIAECLEEETCGPASPKGALEWTLVSRQLAATGRIERNELSGNEQRLRNVLSNDEVNAAEREARKKVAKFPDDWARAWNVENQAVGKP